jgi:hypothetical protein
MQMTDGAGYEGLLYDDVFKQSHTGTKILSYQYCSSRGFRSGTCLLRVQETQLMTQFAALIIGSLPVKLTRSLKR